MLGAGVFVGSGIGVEDGSLGTHLIHLLDHLLDHLGHLLDHLGPLLDHLGQMSHLGCKEKSPLDQLGS